MIIFSYYFSKDLILQENPKFNFRETIMSGYYNISLIEMFESYTLNFDLIKHKEEANYFEELINEKYEKLEDLIIFQIKYIASYNSDSIENRIINLRNTEFNINNMDCAENIDTNEKIFFEKRKFYYQNFGRRYSNEINNDVNDFNYRIVNVRDDNGLIFSNFKNDFKYHYENTVRKPNIPYSVIYDGTYNLKIFQIKFNQVIKFYDRILKNYKIFL